MVRSVHSMVRKHLPPVVLSYELGLEYGPHEKRKSQGEELEGGRRGMDGDDGSAIRE
jgi:hypothetical protein